METKITAYGDRMDKEIFRDAEWIFADIVEQEVVDRYFEYRTEFTCRKDKKVYLYISAYSQYAVYINGQFADSGQYDDYETFQVYDTLDITAFVHEGSNELYVGHYVCGSDFSTRRKQIPGVIFAVYEGKDCILSSGTACEARENRRFLENREWITRQLGYNFEYDSNIIPAVYRPSVSAGKEKFLYPRPVEKLVLEPLQTGEFCAGGVYKESDASKSKAERMQKAYLSDGLFEEYFQKEGDNIHWTVPEEKNADGVYMILDMQKECAGLLAFEIEVPEKTEVLIGFGEHLEDLRVRTKIAYRNFCFRYIAEPGHNAFFYPYQRIGLRYLQFHIASKRGTLKAGIRFQNYPLTQYELPLTDGLHKRIYEVGCDTLKLCMHEHYEDCPWREQAQYAMDSRVQMLCGYYAFREYRMPRAALLLMLRSVKEDGLLDLCAPGRAGSNIPSFTAVFVRQVLEYIEYSGDTEFASICYEGVKKIVDVFAERVTEKDMISLFREDKYWNFYEWQPGLNGAKDMGGKETYEAPFHAFISDTFRCFAEICKLVKPDIAPYYYKLHERVNRAAHAAFWDEKNQAYLTRLGDEAPRHVLTQSLMLYVNAVPEKHKKAVVRSIIEEKLIPCSLSMTIYAYEVLLNQEEDYKEYVQKQIEAVWGKMLNAGATTFWETALGASDFANAGSLCHGWSAVPIYIFGKYFYNK